MAKRPNILWICTDQQRFDTLGCYGNPYVRTPHLDGLAQNGVRFDNCYSQSPVCSPSRGAFLTGRYPHVNRLRQNGQSLPEGELLLPKILADNGYNCGLSGKLHLAPCHTDVCKTTEKRIKDGYSAFYWSHHPQDYGSREGNWANNQYHLWLREQGAAYHSEPYQGSQHVETGMPEALHHTTWCVEKAVHFIEANTLYGQPWFFSVNLFDPHHPFDPPAAYLERYLPMLDRLPLPNFSPEALAGKNRFLKSEYENGAYNTNANFRYADFSDREHRLVKAAYYAMCDLVDAQVGRLLACLRDNGLLEDTLVVFSSDHGEMLGDHGVYMKGPHFYDCAVKVPLILSWAGTVPAGRASPALVELMDVMPTLLDACGIEVPVGVQAQSLLLPLRGEQGLDFHREDVFAEYYNAMSGHKSPAAYLSMLRDSRYKLICVHGEDFGELYDLQNDGAENHNLWNDSAHAAVKTRMLKRLCDRMAFACDPTPIREAEY